jgi:hypothetical protein
VGGGRGRRRRRRNALKVTAISSAEEAYIPARKASFSGIEEKIEELLERMSHCLGYSSDRPNS